tara:strand:- start:552 stop:1739 length:1188 start_codon:yes stop_codon:yes gene_type:complete
MYDFLFVADDGGKTRLQQFLSDTYNEVYSFIFEKDDNGKNKWINFLETAYNDLYAFLFPETTGPSFLDKAKAKLNEMIFGKIIGDPRDGVREGGIINLIADGFAALMKNVTVVKAMKDAIDDMIDTAMSTVDSNLRSMLGMTEGQTFMQKINEMVTSLTNSILDIINRRIPELISTSIGAAKAALGQAVSGTGGLNMSDPDANSAMQTFMLGGDLTPEERGDLIRTLRDEVQNQSMEKGGFDYFMGSLGKGLSTITDPFSDLMGMDNYFTSDDAIRQTIKGLYPELVDSTPQMSNGTNGFENFGAGSLATLHGPEAVVPRNTPAGELLEAFYNSQNSSAGSQEVAYNQTGGDAKLDQLNNTMMQVVALLAQGNQISDRTAKGLRGMTNDFYRGMA